MFIKFFLKFYKVKFFTFYKVILILNWFFLIFGRGTRVKSHYPKKERLFLLKKTMHFMIYFTVNKLKRMKAFQILLGVYRVTDFACSKYVRIYSLFWEINMCSFTAFLLLCKKFTLVIFEASHVVHLNKFSFVLSIFL